MPKGRRGCFDCGEPTALAVQVWLRTWDKGTQDAAGNRLHRSEASIGRSLCAWHGAEVYGSLALLLERKRPYHRGCDRCDSPATHRLAVWLRRLPASTTVDNLAVQLCERCALGLYAQAIVPLDGEWHPQVNHTPAGNLRGARARLRPTSGA